MPHFLLTGAPLAEEVASRISSYPNIPVGMDFSFPTPLPITPHNDGQQVFLEINNDIEHHLKNDQDFYDYLSAYLAIPDRRVVPTNDSLKGDIIFAANRMLFDSIERFEQPLGGFAYFDTTAGHLTSPSCWNNELKTTTGGLNTEQYFQYLLNIVQYGLKAKFDYHLNSHNTLLMNRENISPEYGDYGNTFAYFPDLYGSMTRHNGDGVALDGLIGMAWVLYLAYEKWGDQAYKDQADNMSATFRDLCVIKFTNGYKLNGGPDPANDRYLISSGLPKEADMLLGTSYPPSNIFGPFNLWFYPTYMIEGALQKMKQYDTANATFYDRVITDNREAVEKTKELTSHGLTPFNAYLKREVETPWVDSCYQFAVYNNAFYFGDGRYYLWRAQLAMNGDTESISYLQGQSTFHNYFASNGEFPGGWNANGGAGQKGYFVANCYGLAIQIACGMITEASNNFYNNILPNLLPSGENLKPRNHGSVTEDVLKKPGHHSIALNALYIAGGML